MTPRSFLARLNTDGTLDMPFNPGPNDFVWSLTMQVDGKIIIGGWFDMVGGTAHSHVARLNADGTVDTAFNPQAGGPVVFNTSLQSDGRIVIGGTFTNVDGLVRNRVARLVNDSATQSLIVPNASRVEWRRGGASPEAQDVSFEVSADDGTTWRLLGAGTRIAGGWEKDGLSLPVTGQVRARARVVGGQNNGSSGLVETVTAYSLLTSRLTGATLLGNGSFQFGFTNLSGVPFTALGTTNLTLPSSNWNVLGPATEIFPGQFQFIDLSATNFPRRFYQIRSP
jgi:hypothetical protein